MIRRFVSPLIVMFGVAAATPAFAEYEHCYEATSSGHATKSSAELSQRAFGIEYALIPVLYRRVCDLSNAQDMEYLEALVQYVGCSPDSDLGQTLMQTLTVDLSDLEGLQELDVWKASYPDHFGHMCELVADLPRPEVDEEFDPLVTDRSAEHRILQAIEQLNRRFLEAHPDLAR